MKMFFFLSVVAAFSSSSARAELVKPGTFEGKALVHELADKVTRGFVAETERLEGRSEAEAPDCESTRTSALEGLARFEIKSSHHLSDAKRELEKAVCAAAQSESVSEEIMGPPAPKANDARATQNHFFSATLALRSLEGSLN